MSTGKKIIRNNSNSSQSKNIKFISPKNSPWIVQQDTWHNGYRRWFPKLLRRQLSGGCWFNPYYRWVAIQEYLTLVLVMANGIRTGDHRGFNKGRSSKFWEGSQVWQEGQRTYRPKRCGNTNKDEENSPKTLNDKNLYYADCKF